MQRSNDRRRPVRVLPGSFVLVFCHCLLHGSVRAEYTEPASFTNPQHVITLGSPGYSVANADDTAVFQRAIDDVAAAGGGRVMVPRGAYEATAVQLKSNVHLVFDGQSTIRPHVGGSFSNNLNIFELGRRSHVQNVSVRGIHGWSSFELDVNDHDRLRAFGVFDAQNFLISNFNVDDSRSTFSGIVFGWRGENSDGSPQIPIDGTVQHFRTSNAHYGYGAIQAHASHNVVFRDIESVGGVAVRFETGIKNMNLAQNGGLDQVHVEDVTSYRGQAALMLTPHAMHHGDVTAANLRSFGSEYTVLIDTGGLHKFTDQEIEDYNLTKGTFNSITIDGVESVFSDGPTETRWTHLHHYPVELHPLLYKVSSAYDHRFRGPAIAPVKNPFQDDPSVTITNIVSRGFEFHPDQIDGSDFIPAEDRGGIFTNGTPAAGRILGDINDDELWTAADLDLLYDAFGSVTVGGPYDLANKDGIANFDDVTYWLREIVGGEFGDANLDGRVSPLDVEVLAANFNQPGSWADGDFNGDGLVNQSDLLILKDYYDPHPADGEVSLYQAAIDAGLPLTAGDFNVDFQVNGADFLAWQRGEVGGVASVVDLDPWQANYGTGSGFAAATIVPEPAGIAVLLASLLVWFSAVDGKCLPQDTG